jgi:two-component system response regulator AtoC
LLAHKWPGNVRELKNVMQYIAAAHAGSVVTAEHVTARLGRRRETEQVAVLLPPDPASFRPLADEIRELEIARMRAALEATGGNQTRAAALLAMPVRTFFEKVKQYRLQPRKRGSTSSPA